MSDLLPVAIGLVASALAVAGLAAAGRAARRTRTRRHQAAELQWARNRLRSAARSAHDEITTWMTGREGPLRDALVAVHTELDVARDRRLDPPGHPTTDQDPPDGPRDGPSDGSSDGSPDGPSDVADLDALAAAYDAVGRLAAPVRDVLDRVSVIRDRLADLDGAGDAVPTGLHDRVAALLQAADDAAAHLVPAPPATAVGLADAREGLERLGRRSDQVAAEVYRRWSRRFPDRAGQQGAAPFDAWLDAVRREHGQARPPANPTRRPRPQEPPPDDPPEDPGATSSV